VIAKLQGSATPLALSIRHSGKVKDQYTLTCTGFATMDLNDLRALVRAYRVDIDDIRLLPAGMVVHIWPDKHKRPEAYMWVSEGVYAVSRDAFDAQPPPAKRARTDDNDTMSFVLVES